MSLASSDPPSPRIPRNSRLSAYYNPAGPSSSSATHHVATDTAAPNPSTVVPPHRREAIGHASHLASSLPFSDMLTHVASLRRSAASKTASLHASSRHNYTHLSAAHSAASDAYNLADRLSSSGPLPTTLEMANTCRITCERLAATRESLASLDATRQLTILQVAAPVAAEALRNAHIEAATLCTEPIRVRNDLLLAARRAIALAHTVRVLAQEASQFRDASRTLDQAITDVRHAVASRLEAAGDEDDDEDIALDPPDAAVIWLILGGDRSTVFSSLTRAAARLICGPVISSTARTSSQSSSGAIGVARAAVEFAVSETLPRVVRTTQWLDAAFPNWSDDDDKDIAAWASVVVDEAIVSRVHVALRDDSVLNTGVEEAKSFGESLVRLSSAAAKIGEGGGRSSRVVAASFQVPLSALHNAAGDRAAAEAAGQVRRVIHSVLDGAYAGDKDHGVRAAKHVWNAAKESAEAGRPLCGARTGESLMVEALRDATEACVASLMDGETKALVSTARAAMLGREIARHCSVEGRMVVNEVRDAACSEVVDGVCALIDRLIMGRMRMVSGSKWVGGGIEETSQVLALADKAGRECGVEALKGGVGVEGEGLFSEAGAVGARVGRAWVERLRDMELENEEQVEAVRREAEGVKQWLGEEMVERVAATAAERCVRRLA